MLKEIYSPIFEKRLNKNKVSDFSDGIRVACISFLVTNRADLV